jgi:hypothetical protein
LDWETDGHDFVVFDDLDIACVELEELVGLALCKVLQDVHDLGQGQGELVGQVEDVEALLHVISERVFVQGFLNELLLRLLRFRVCRRGGADFQYLRQKSIVDILHSPGQNEEIIERSGQFLVDVDVSGALYQRVQEVGGLHFESIELLLFGVCREPLHFDFRLRLLSLLNQISATIDDLGLHKSPLVHPAGSLDQFDESVEDLGT